jgi:hypothetical protein
VLTPDALQVSGKRAYQLFGKYGHTILASLTAPDCDLQAVLIQVLDPHAMALHAVDIVIVFAGSDALVQNAKKLSRGGAYGIVDGSLLLAYVRNDL